MNKRELKRPETVEVEAIGSLVWLGAGKAASSLSGGGHRKGPCLAGVAASLLQAEAQVRLRPRHTPCRVRASASPCRPAVRREAVYFV